MKHLPVRLFTLPDALIARWFLLAAIAVALGGFLTNFLEMRRALKFPKHPDMPRMS